MNLKVGDKTHEGPRRSIQNQLFSLSSVFIHFVAIFEPHLSDYQLPDVYFFKFSLCYWTVSLTLELLVYLLQQLYSMFLHRKEKSSFN